MTETIVDLMRHGEPVGGRRYRGQSDDPLSEKGWREMRLTVGEHRPWQAVVTSPLSRCRAFAEELAQRLDLELDVDERLIELGFGEWEGKTAAEIMAHDGDMLPRFWRDPLNNRPPGGEPLADFRDRVVGAWDAHVRRHAERHTLVIAHAGVIRMILRHVLDMPLDRMFRIQVPSAGISRIAIDGGEPPLARLVFHAGRL